MNSVSGGVCAPRGFRAGAAAAGIKNPQGTRLDCALILSDAPAAVAGCFTTNRVKAAPVLWDQGVCVGGAGRAVFVNSGNANACTGDRGLDDVKSIAALVASAADVPVTEVLVCSTGVIGVPLPMDRMERGVRACAAALSPEGGADAARAIMTTDTVPKEFAVEVPLSGGAVRIGSIAKGSGMIAPNMATMLCFITTDAALAPADLQALLRRCTERTFNRICVDNDTSTNDTVLCLANGQAGGSPLTPGTADFDAFAEALEALCAETAKALVRDGEGATKFIEITVEGAATDGDARLVARSIAQSQLCKTAFFGEDPNWGRIACAAGYSGADFDPSGMSIVLEGLTIFQDGRPTDYEEADAAERMKRREVRVRVLLSEGAGRAAWWTSDLSHDYVSINADYRS